MFNIQPVENIPLFVPEKWIGYFSSMYGVIVLLQDEVNLRYLVGPELIRFRIHNNVSNSWFRHNTLLSLISLFRFLSLIMACFTGIEMSLVFMLRNGNCNILLMQMADLELTLDLFFAFLRMS